MERVIAATPERLFALWTEPEELIKWWGPEGFTTPQHDMDVRPGGRWRTTMRSPEGKHHTVSGIYRTIEPPRRIVFTWGWDDDNGMRGHETEVTVTFEPTPGGTRMVLTQQAFADAEAAAGTSTAGARASSASNARPRERRDRSDRHADRFADRTGSRRASPCSSRRRHSPARATRFSAARRALPWEKVETTTCSTASAAASASPTCSRARPAHRLSLHVRPGLGGRLQELLVLGRQFRPHRRASQCARHQSRRDLARAVSAPRRLSQAHGLELRVGLLARQFVQPRLRGLVSRA